MEFFKFCDGALSHSHLFHIAKVDDPQTTSLLDKSSKDRFFRSLLPLDIEALTGAVVLGNPDLATILVFQFEEAKGMYRAISSVSQYDYYKSVLNLTFTKPNMQLRANVDYREPLLTQAARWRMQERHTRVMSRVTSFLENISIFETSGTMGGGPNPASVRGKHGGATWAGLSRYKKLETEAERLKRFLEQYARVSTVVEAPQLKLTYYVDIAGKSGYLKVLVRDKKARSKAVVLAYQHGIKHQGVNDKLPYEAYLQQFVYHSTNNLDNSPIFVVNSFPGFLPVNVSTQIKHLKLD
ncbi:hypothetical protein HDU93_009912 [Gonapodya sp. JEL0774]|nr:hypothetical protein HDU93_009912 [Gonapodya sp. JEL0774]